MVVGVEGRMKRERAEYRLRRKRTVNGPLRPALLLLAPLLVAFLAVPCLTAQPASPPGDETVVAMVGDEPIHAAEVQRLLARAIQGKKTDPTALPVLKAQVLDEIVSRRLVLAYAKEKGQEAKASEIEAALSNLKTKLAAQKQTIDDYLKARSLGEADLRRQLAWNVVWERYFARYATQARFDSFFENHRRELDGTQVSVSQILLRLPPGAGPAAIADLVNRAEAIRTEIASGKFGFADAAQKYSSGPSSKEGGRLGPIGRHAPMDEAFSRAAFALEAGQVSRPVVTTFGVHLIRCDQIKPGRKQPADVRKEIEEALARELLDKISETQRRTTAVKYTGASPHFKPGTRELAP
jgi:parvulin-like peptidyl-prolyl isomerase